jgi:hypothetical protein
MWKRYKCVSDTSITNNYKLGGTIRATGSNMGMADSLEVNLHSSSYLEYETRALLKFDMPSVISDRNSGLTVSGSTAYILKLSDVAHDLTTPKNISYTVKPVISEWDEGYGTDSYNYMDPGYYASGSGATWVYRLSSSIAGIEEWDEEGGDFAEAPTYTQLLVSEDQDIELDITGLVEQWIAGIREDYGIGVLTSQSNSLTRDTKKFSSRTSEYWFSRPYLEARWDSSVKDNRGNFQPSSSLYSSANNLNTLFYRNYFRGQLTDLTQNEVFVRFYTAPTGGDQLYDVRTEPVTGSKTTTGIYAASVAIETTSSVLYDRWYSTTSGSVPFYVGEINVLQDDYSNNSMVHKNKIIKITNMKDSYHESEVALFRVYTRNYNTTNNYSIYSTAVATPVVDIVDNMYYRVLRIQDELEVVPYMTGSENGTRVSYDASGSYFTLNMNEFEPDYGYEIRLAVYEGGFYKEHDKNYKFRVEKKYV